MIALLLAALALQGETVAGVPYEKLETREATFEAMRAKIVDEPHTFGDFHLLTPFPYSGHGTGGLATVHAPEEELPRYAAGGPGPDLARRWVGRRELDVGWRDLGPMVNRKCDLHVFQDPELNDDGTAYVYFAIHAREDCEVPVTMGSDDGLRFWLNGELLIDHDVAARDDAGRREASRSRLKEGTQPRAGEGRRGDGGGWEYQINSRRAAPEPSRMRSSRTCLDRDFPLLARARRLHACSVLPAARTTSSWRSAGSRPSATQRPHLGLDAPR